MRDYGPQSLKELQKEVDLHPTNAEDCHELGYIHKSLRNHEKAIEALQKELGLDSSIAFSWNLGLSHSNLGNYEKLPEVFQKPVDLIPDLATQQ